MICVYVVCRKEVIKRVIILLGNLDLKVLSASSSHKLLSPCWSGKASSVDGDAVNGILISRHVSYLIYIDNYI